MIFREMFPISLIFFNFRAPPSPSSQQLLASLTGRVGRKLREQDPEQTVE